MFFECMVGVYIVSCVWSYLGLLLRPRFIYMDFETDGCAGHDSEYLLLIDKAGFAPDLALLCRSPDPFDGSVQGSVKQLQIASTKPILPFLTMPYVHAQCILHLARNVQVFHVLSVFIARKALRLVILLNNRMDQDEGPGKRERDERITLQKELVELENAIREWGTESDDQAKYAERVAAIKEQYNQFTRSRFYYRSTQNLVKDEVLQKLLTYEESNMALMQRLRSAGGPMDDMDVDDPMSE